MAKEPLAYYNETDPYCVAWLRNLIAAKLIAPGIVDERPIQDVRPYELSPFTQCHFFAGIGGWSLALRLADIPDHRPLWTGSCPCQPFSQAGARRGFADERHLWPFWYHLIAQRRPATVLGEQVSGVDGREWLSGVHTDLENEGYAVGASDLPAACAGAPHCRQRYFFVAKSESEQVGDGGQPRVQSCASGIDALEHTECERVRGEGRNPLVGTQSGVQGADGERIWADARTTGLSSELGDSDSDKQHWWSGPLQVGWNAIEGDVERSGRKYRAQWRVKPGISIVAHGVSNRVAKLRAFGNAIVPQVAAKFIKAALT